MTSLQRGRVPSPRPIPVKEVPLVDRTEEMNALKEAVYRAVHGEGGLVFVHGEAGIGKTRLVRELGAYAQSRGVQVLYGRCPALFRMDGVPPYVLWKEVIKDYLETCTSEQLYRVIGYYPAEVAKLVPELSQKLRAIPQSFSISPKHEQNRLFEAVSQFITNISQETPLLVVLDDLQWTDPSSLLLLHYVARGAQKASLLLLGAYRSTDIDDKHPLTPVLAELNRERLPQEIQLKRMSFGDVSEMIKNILEQEDVPEEFCKLVYDKTRGNPFFAEEVVKSLKEEEVIYLKEGGWRFKEVSAIGFPKSVRNIVKARFSRLDDECQSVLTFASFIGNDFTLEAISALAGIEEDKLLEIMDRLIKIGFVKHTVIRGEDICSFADIIVRDVVYEEVGPFRRKKLHGVVGEILEKMYADKADEHLGELALHFLESGDKNKALDYFLKAGEKAQKIYANSEAASYFQSAFTLLEEKEGEILERAHVLERLGDIKRFVGEYPACLRYLDDARLLLEQMHEKESVSRLHRKIANVLWEGIGDTEKAMEHQNKALEILEAEPESVELARLYGDMAHMYWRIGNTERARPLAEKALEFAKKLSNSEIIATSCLDLGTIFSVVGESKKAVEFIKIALQMALDSQYMETATRAYINLAAALPLEEMGRKMEYFEKAYELAKKTGDIEHLSWVGESLASMYEGMGNMKKAISLSKESVALDRKTGNPNHLSMSLGRLGYEYLILGEWDKSEEYIKEAFNIAQGLKDFQAIADGYGNLCWLHARKGEYAKVKELAAKGYEAIKKTGAKTMQWWYAYWIANTCLELGEIEEALSQINNLYGFALKMKASNKQFIAYADRLKARLFRAEKKGEESIQYFEKSLQEAEALGAKRWWVYDYARHFLYEYALAYLDRDKEGDKEKALNLLSQALEMFQKMGAKKDIQEVEARMAFIETGKEVSKPKPIEVVSTGYAELDKLLYGGIPSNCAVVLTSPSCNERTSLVKSFLETGAKKGEVTFFATIDPSAGKPLAEEFNSNFYLFICNPEANAIIKDSPNVFKMKGVENLTDISIALTTAIRKLDPSLKGPRRICIGLVSDVLLYHHAVETRRWLTALMTKLKSEGFTTLAVMGPQMHPSEELHAVLGLFGGEIQIRERETEEGSEKILKIKRMSNQKYLKDEIPLRRESL